MRASILPVSKARTNKFYIYRQCTYVVYLCNQCLSPLKLSVLVSPRRGILDTTLSDKVCQCLTAAQWFSPGTPVSPTNNTDCHEITEILLKVALNTITLTR
jgi:hypothetical protein